MSAARTLMIQGTASSVGKSLLVTAFCRILRDEGIRVAPFKAQNMALNAAVTPDGREVGRAQAVQAEAAGIEVTVDMNPVLLKPESDGRSQVVVLGRPAGHIEARTWRERRAALAPVIADALARLRAAYEVVVIEGAGSPAEVNLKDTDLVNMHVARLADAPVLLAADIDRGGVFASLVGTLELLDPEDRGRVAGFVINKFRGDRGLLQPGLDFLERRTGVPVLGVVPYLRDLRVADEDSVSLDERARRARPPANLLDVVVIRLPHLANQDDYDPLEAEPGVSVRYVDEPAAIVDADLVVLPGTKTTRADLAWLRARGFEAPLRTRSMTGAPLLGICGGCQMLGQSIDDPEGVEGAPGHEVGLGLLPVQTRFRREKTTTRVQARAATASFLTGGERLEAPLTGYEIHAGEVTPAGPSQPALHLTMRGETPIDLPDGAVAGAVVGTLVHGLLSNAPLRRHLLSFLRHRRGLPDPASGEMSTPSAQDEYDRLARAVREHLAWRTVRGLLKL